MKFTNKELEEIITIAEQCKIMIPKLSYNEELTERLFTCMKDKKKVAREDVQRCHNNYLALNIIGLNQCDSEVFKKLDKYMDNEY